VKDSLDTGEPLEGPKKNTPYKIKEVFPNFSPRNIPQGEDSLDTAIGEICEVIPAAFYCSIRYLNISTQYYHYQIAIIF